MDELLSYRDPILKTLRELKIEYKERFKLHPWSSDVLERVFDFSEKGKLLRGALVIFSARTQGVEINNDILRTAAAMELIHSSLLIHDDIMDKDTWRRGNRSVYSAYEQLAIEKDLYNPAHLGVSMGVGVGDITFFLVFEIISGLESPSKDTLIKIFSHELIQVGFGQLDDLWPLSISKERILELYKYKTGRYSFSLPMMMGAILAGTEKTDLEPYIHFGESMGPLFQIADDLLGIYGSQEEIGKPVGSDIRDGKQTLYWYLLMEKATNEEKLQLLSFFGKEANAYDISVVINLIEKHGIDKELLLIVDMLKSKANMTIATLPIDPDSQAILRTLVTYVTTRSK